MRSQANPVVFLIVVLAWTWALTWTAIFARAKGASLESLGPLVALGSMGFVPLAIFFAFREGGWAAVGGAARKTFIVPRNLSPWLLALVAAAVLGVFLYRAAKAGGLRVSGARENSGEPV